MCVSLCVASAELLALLATVRPGFQVCVRVCACVCVCVSLYVASAELLALLATVRPGVKGGGTGCV